VLWPVSIPQKSRRAEVVTVRSAAKTVCSNAAQFAGATAAVRAIRAEAEIIDVQVMDDWVRALETAKSRQVEAGYQPHDRQDAWP